MINFSIILFHVIFLPSQRHSDALTGELGCAPGKMRMFVNDANTEWLRRGTCICAGDALELNPTAQKTDLLMP